MKSHHIWKSLLGGCAILAIAVCGLSIASLADDRDHDDWRPGKNANQDEKRKIEIGQRISPVPLNLRHKDDETVYLGSYLVNAVGGCNDCHTNPPYAPNGNPYLGQPKKVNSAGYMGGGMPFGPSVTSRNLTPDITGRPAGMTLPEFIHVMRTGDDPDDVHGAGVPLQVMPWPVYQSMTDRDLAAIYAFLSAIPCLEGDPGVNPNAPPRCH
jgi:hypothetical protein